MEYRAMEKLGVKTSLLGFGCMRFPKNADGSINEPMAEQMLDEAIASGVNYIDTAYPYHGGDSEPFVGRVLDKYDRDRYLLATKLPVWKVNSQEDAQRIFEEQLVRLNKDYVDFYLLHALDKARWENVKKQGLLEFGAKLKEQGKIKAFGFSFHDDYEVFEEILTSYPWDFCQIQFNYMDIRYQAGEKGYELAKRLGIPMVVMEPVRGGSLAALEGSVAELFRQEDPEASAASWGYRWVASHDNVKVILSGMSEPAQVRDNLNTFEHYRPLSEQEQQVIVKVREAIEAKVKNGCTACRYCMPCPAGVDIPGNFKVWNHYSMYGNRQKAKNEFAELGEKAQAASCVQCGRCEQQCPQHIPIREHLKEVCKTVMEVRNA